MLYGRYDIALLLIGRFDFYLPLFNQAISYIESINIALKKWNPLLIVTVYEEGATGRAATIVGQSENVPTLALQHGMIS